MEFEIVVVASENRRPLISKHLKGIPHQISITPNYELPEDFKPEVKTLVRNHMGAYRCFRGHQQALSLSTAEVVLVLEDDAVPNKPSWMYSVSNAIYLLGFYDMVSFHGRQHNPNNFEPAPNNSSYLQSSFSEPWIVAALAYMVNRKSIAKLLSWRYNGIPWDIMLYRKLTFCLQKQSMFNHDRSGGSLIDV